MEKEADLIQMEFYRNRQAEAEADKRTAMLEQIKAEKDLAFLPDWQNLTLTKMKLEIENLKTQQIILEKIERGEITATIKVS